MNNLPLQPLVWKGAAMANVTHFEAQGAGVFYRINKIDSNHVVVWHDQSEGSSGSKELKSLEEAKKWAEFTHYPSKMQPYVKSMPTWINAKKQLPTHHQDVIVYRYRNGNSSIEHSLYLNGEVMKGFGNVADEDGFFDDVYYWQPIETKAIYEAMAMQLQIKGE